MAPPPAPRLLLAALLLLLVALLQLAVAPGATASGGVFQVRRKFPAGVGVDAGAGAGAGTNNISAHRAHDDGHRIAAVDLPLGRLGGQATGLYFTEIKLGTPPKPYHVLVDTGSDFLQVNCISCEKCPHKSGHHFYDPKAFSSGSTVHCNQSFCVVAFGPNPNPDCTPNTSCIYSTGYTDGSSTFGFFVTDVLQFDQVTRDGQTQQANAAISFGCVTAYDGHLGSSIQALDGILGLGRDQDNTSMLSQLSAAGKLKKIFAHCLDARKGGGIFAIGGDVVQQKVKTTPFVPGMPSYNVNLKSVDVGGTTLQLPAHVFETGRKKGTIIDSSTTLTYLPELVFKKVLEEVFKHQDITFHHVQDFLCFHYSGCVDDGFPTVTFHFKNDLAMHVYPHEYLFPNGVYIFGSLEQNDLYCVGFQNSTSLYEKDILLMGDLVLSNKLVVYDLENQVIGWTDYNCSLSIKIKDDKTGKTYAVNSHDISTRWKFH